MNAKDLLNMDMETAIQWLLHFWRWWIDELVGMLPPQWRERLMRRNHVVAELRGDGLVYRTEGSDTYLTVKPRGPVKALMPRAQVLVRQVELPLLPVSDIRRMVALDIDRLTPFQPEQIVFDVEVVSRDPDNGRQQVALGVVLRDAAGEFLDALRARHLSPSAIGVAAPENATGTRFDFLAALRDAEGGSAAQRRALYWWGGVAAAVILNLVLLTYRDSNSLEQLRQTVEAQQGPVSVAIRTRDKVDHEAARRAALLAGKAESSPLPVLDAVTRALPADAWVRRFEWNGRTVRVIGARKTSQDILARLEASPDLRNAHALSPETHPDAAGNQQFEYAADRELGKTR